MRHWAVSGALCFLLIAFLAVASNPATGNWGIDEKDFVDRIVDGDTFHAVRIGRVRLADIDSPEVGKPGAKEASAYLSFLVFHRQVYLDIDDLRGTDRYNRVVAVVFVRHNATHLLNVNEALLKADLSAVADFLNEFDPTRWTLYVRYPTDTGSTSMSSGEMPQASIAAIVIIPPLLILLLGYVCGRRFRHSARSEKE